jgi:hypothetical protein
LFESLGFELDFIQKLSKTRLTEVRVSAMQIKHVLEGPHFITNKVDMSVGGVDLCIWGTHDVPSAKIEMVVGMPASTLVKLGLRDLPSDYVLPCALGGTNSSLQIDYRAAMSRLARLFARQQYLQMEKHLQTSRVDNLQASWMSRKLIEGIQQFLVVMTYKDKWELINEIEDEIYRDLHSVPRPWSLPGS